jgi:hypothetical protein
MMIRRKAVVPVPDTATQPVGTARDVPPEVVSTLTPDTAQPTVPPQEAATASADSSNISDQPVLFFDGGFYTLEEVQRRASLYEAIAAHLSRLNPAA